MSLTVAHINVGSTIFEGWLRQISSHKIDDMMGLMVAQINIVSIVYERWTIQVSAH